MSILIKEIVKYLGSQTKFLPTKTNDLHSVHQQSINKNYNSQQIQNILDNDENYSNAKIIPNSAPEGYRWIILDYDDKEKTGNITDMAQQFSLVPTFTVKTPTGAGKQEWYIIPKEKASQLIKFKYKIPNYEDVEIFIPNEKDNWLFTSPGCIKDNVEYTIVNATQPKVISNNLFTTLKNITDHDIQKFGEICNSHAHRFNEKVDTHKNKSEYLSWLNEQISGFDLGKPPLTTGRDNFIFQCACQGFTFNLSKQVVQELIMAKIVLNSQVISDYNNEFNDDVINLKINSAYNTIHSDERNQQRVKTQELELFKQDEYGYVTITREAYQKKVLYLSKFTISKIMNTPQLLEMFCELVVQDSNTGLYYIPNIISFGQYNKFYQKSIEEERRNDNQISIQEIISKLADTTLHWKELDQKSLGQLYKIQSGTRNKPLDGHPVFLQLSHSCQIYSKSVNKKILLEDGCFYPETNSPIEPVNNATDEEISEINELIKIHISRIVDPKHYEEESSWLLDRYSTLLQNPTAKIDNAIIFKGTQGSGKTSFIEILMLLFPRSDTNILLGADDLENRFIQFTRILHIDDVNFNLKNNVTNKLKAIVTTSRVPNEQKFKNRVVNDGTVNISVSTNDAITDKEILCGRRWTIFINDTPFIREQVQKDVRNLFKRLKGDNWRMFKVLHSVLLNRNVSNFKNEYKTQAQIALNYATAKGNDFSKGLANMIANYGYVTPDKRVIIPGEMSNRNDITVVLFKHYLLLDSEDYTPDIDLLISDKGFKLFHHFANTRDERLQIKFVYNESFVDCETQSVKSRINTLIRPTWSNKVPPIRKWIELLSVSLLGNRNKESIKYIVDIYEFKNQWEWDNTTKPDIDNLGNINIFDTIEFDLINEEEEF